MLENFNDFGKPGPGRKIVPAHFKRQHPCMEFAIQGCLSLPLFRAYNGPISVLSLPAILLPLYSEKGGKLGSIAISTCSSHSCILLTCAGCGPGYPNIPGLW